MIDDLLAEALSDTRLSHRALGVLLRAVASGSVPNADELAGMGREGRDAMRSALRQLIDLGYVTSDRRQRVVSDGGWSTHRGLAKRPEIVRGNPVEKGGFSASKSGFSGVKSSKSSKGNNKSRSTPNGVDLLFRARGARGGEAEAEVPGWNDIFGPTSTEDDGVPETKNDAKKLKRSAKDRALWSIGDIVDEFGDRVQQHVPDEVRVGQAGTIQLRKILGRWKKGGLLNPAEGQALIELFFGDPRNLHRPGFDPPLWLRFVQFIPHAKAQAREMSGLSQAPGPTPEQVEEDIARAQSVLDAHRRHTA